MSFFLSLERFKGKVAVITGASAGIGKKTTELLVKHGVIVAGIARRVQRLEEHSKQLSGEKGKLHSYQCDVSKQDEIFATFKKITTELGPIHILINNAGMVLPTTIIDGDIDKWKTALDINLLAVAICIREAIASMKLNNIKGHIININSMAGHRVPNFPPLNVYSATKFGLKALTETVRLEINREKLPIKITNLSPGYVKTEFAVAAFGDGPENIFEGRPGLEAEDLADAILYILSTPEHVNVKELTVTIQGYEA